MPTTGTMSANGATVAAEYCAKSRAHRGKRTFGSTRPTDALGLATLLSRVSRTLRAKSAFFLDAEP